MTHTPGIWYMDSDGSREKWYVHYKDYEAAHTGFPYVIASIPQGPHAKADARLLTAAPKLLQALKCALADLEGSLEAHEQSNQHDWEAHKQSIREAHLAINQAIGESL